MRLFNSEKICYVGSNTSNLAGKAEQAELRVDGKAKRDEKKMYLRDEANNRQVRWQAKERGRSVEGWERWAEIFATFIIHDFSGSSNSGCKEFWEYYIGYRDYRISVECPQVSFVFAKWTYKACNVLSDKQILDFAWFSMHFNRVSPFTWRI